MANRTLIKRFLPHISAIVIFLLGTCIYFLPQLEGKIVPAGDIVSYKGMASEITKYKEETGERTLWTNSIFGGMPTFQIDGSQPKNLIQYVEKASQLFFKRPIGYFFAMAIMFYIFLVYLKINPWLSIIGAIAFSLSVGNMTLFEAGHMTKLRVLASFGLIATGFFMLFKEKYLTGGIIYALGLGISLYANHVQMTYYFYLALGIYVLIELFKRFKTGEWAAFGKTFLVLILATMIGVGSSASKLWTTYEYAKDTMRGDPILATTGEPTSSSETKGLEWGYAMNWSNGWLDLFSSIIPGVAGGGSGEKLSKDSALAKDLRKKGVRVGNDFKAGVYWGSLPVTSGPMYFGAIFCFLFILGLMLVKGPMKWWIAIVVLLMLLASMGKNFALLNKPLFDFFPLFNKFRTPNSILVVAGFFVPLLGMLTLSGILKGSITKESIIKKLYIALGISGGLCLFFAFLAPGMFDFSSLSDARMEQAGYSLDALHSDRKSLMRKDSLRSLVLILLSGGLIWAFVKEKIKASVLIAATGILAIGDIWTVSKRYVDSGDFVSKRNYEKNFTPRPVDTEIMKDQDPNYRVLDLSVNTFNSATSSYFHKTIGGYHPAKLQRYDDIIYKQIVDGNQAVLAMLNTKYFISQDQKVQPFSGLGNAWTVSSLKMVNTPNEEFESLEGFDPKTTAIVHNEFANYVSGLNPTGTGNIKLTEYKPDHLTYTSQGSSDELAVFSEVWYGPNKGWDAYIDGQLVDHIRVNYILRALKIPAGNHKVEFKFEPSSYYRGEMVTLIFSLLLVLGLLWVLYKEGIKIKNGEEVE